MPNKEKTPAIRGEKSEGQKVPIFCQYCHTQLGTAIDDGKGNLTHRKLNYKVLNMKCPKHPTHNNHSC